MKKLLTSFADSLLSKEQMKRVKGGYGDNTHYVKCYCADGIAIACEVEINEQCSRPAAQAACESCYGWDGGFFSCS